MASRFDRADASPNRIASSPPRTVREVEFTTELREIIQCKLAAGDKLLITAVAGAGKSTALKEYAKANPSLEFLFLVFNEEVRTEKEGEFAREGISNVVCRTLHGLAYENTQQLHEGKPPVDSLLLERRWLARATSSTTFTWDVDALDALRDTLERFFASTARTPSERHLSPLATGDVALHLLAASRVWAAIIQKELPCSHNAYLKYFHGASDLRRRVMRSVDMVLLDEAHDCTELELDMVANAGVPSVIVYDPHQSIYMFRHVVGSAGLDGLRGYRRSLTMTYRYGPPLSSAAQAVIRHYTGHTDFIVRGLPTTRTHVVQSEHPPFSRVCGAGDTLVILGRTNMTLLRIALSMLDHPDIGRVSGRLFESVGSCQHLLDVVTLSCGGGEGDIQEQGGLASSCAATGRGFTLFERLVKERRIRSSMNACSLVRLYGPCLAGLALRLRARLTVNLAAASVLFYTGHRAKGHGWPYVYVCHDFMLRCTPLQATARAQRMTPTPLELLSESVRWATVFELLEPEPKTGNPLLDEVRLLYVAMTRAMHTLYISASVAAWLRLAGVDVPVR